MPSYSIECKKCGHKFDVFTQTISKYEKIIKEGCPKCKGQLSQDMSESSANFVLKGLGWASKSRTQINEKNGKVASQEAHDQALRENDDLNYMAEKKLGAWGKRDEELKRAKDQAAKDGAEL